MKYNFTRKMRLLAPYNFAHVFRNARRITQKNITILSCENFLGYPRIGFSITKKNIQHAYERNRIKRILRESFRLHQHILPSMDFVVIAKKSDTLKKDLTSKNIEVLWYRCCYLAQRS